MKNDLPNTALRASLLSPSELQEELARLVQRPRFSGHALMTGLADPIVRLFESTLLQQNTSLSLYESLTGRACALLWIQAGPAVLRILVPLGTKTACEWLIEGLEKKRFLLALDVAETHQLAVVQVPVQSSDSALAFARAAHSRAPWVTGTPDEFADVLLEIRRVVQGLLLVKPDSMLPGIQVEESYLALAVEVPAPITPPTDSQARH